MSERDERQRQLDALREKFEELSGKQDRVWHDIRLVEAWIEGWDARDASLTETVSNYADPVPAIVSQRMVEDIAYVNDALASPIGERAGIDRATMAQVDQAVLDMLGPHGNYPLEDIQKAFTWSKFETDGAIARLFERGEITLGERGYRRRHSDAEQEAAQ